MNTRHSGVQQSEAEPRGDEVKPSRVRVLATSGGSGVVILPPHLAWLSREEMSMLHRLTAPWGGQDCACCAGPGEYARTDRADLAIHGDPPRDRHEHEICHGCWVKRREGRFPAVRRVYFTTRINCCGCCKETTIGIVVRGIPLFWRCKGRTGIHAG